MEDQHLTQQNFAQQLGISTATLSSIFNDRTKPSLLIVDAIKKKFPRVNSMALPLCILIRWRMPRRRLAQLARMARTRTRSICMEALLYQPQREGLAARRRGLAQLAAMRVAQATARWSLPWILVQPTVRPPLLPHRFSNSLRRMV